MKLKYTITINVEGLHRGETEEKNWVKEQIWDALVDSVEHRLMEAEGDFRSNYEKYEDEITVTSVDVRRTK